MSVKTCHVDVAARHDGGDRAVERRSLAGQHRGDADDARRPRPPCGPRSSSVLHGVARSRPRSPARTSSSRSRQSGKRQPVVEPDAAAERVGEARRPPSPRPDGRRGASRAIAAPRSIVTPITRTPGLIALAASATPAARPPPDSGTRIVARSGRSSSSLQPDRALPGDHERIVEGGDLDEALLASQPPALGHVPRPGCGPTIRTSAPSARMPSTLACGTSADMQTTARRPAPGARHRRRRARDCRSNSRSRPRRPRRAPATRIDRAAQLEGADRLRRLELQQELVARAAPP